jgi:hypothetical protein
MSQEAAMRITSQVRTVDGNGRVWIRTETGPGEPDTRYAASEQQAHVALVPDSELAELAARIAR